MKLSNDDVLWDALAIMDAYAKARQDMRRAQRTVGPLLRRYRLAQGLGLRELARQAGVSAGLLSRIERRRDWSAKVATAALRALQER